MNRTVLLTYQLLTGASDAFTGALLVIAPAMALGLMRLHAPADGLVYISYIGSFVFAVGLCCFYGAYLVVRGDACKQLATVWLLTAFLRASVASFVAQQVLSGALPFGWVTVAGFDGACVLLQAIGLRRGWVANVPR